MPAAAAVSTRPVPFGTSTSRSSIRTLTRSVMREPAPRGGCASQRAPAGRRGTNPVQRAAPLVDVRLELVPELVEIAHDRDRVGVAERAEAFAVDALGHGDEEVHVGLRAAAVLDLLQDLGQPARPDSARGALPAGLVLVELRHPHGELHHAAAVVDRDHGSRADRRPGADERVEVERHAPRLGGGEDDRRGAAWDDRLELAAAGDAAADVVDELPQREAVRELVVAAVDDVAREGEDARARRALEADLRVRGPADLENQVVLVIDSTLLTAVGEA